MSVLNAIGHNLKSLLIFRGRETRAQFWPYAACTIIAAIAGMMAIMLPEMSATMERMQRFAAEHPDQATVQSGPGGYSIRIHGHHPELMPNFGGMMSGIAIVAVIIIALLAASVTRRLHDSGKTGAWGLLPIPFLAFGSVMMPRVFAQSQPDMSLFFAIFINNFLYIASLVLLVVLLAGASTKGENRYGPEGQP